MPATTACSPATRMLFRQFRGLGTVADGGRQALESDETLHLRGRAPARPRNPAKSRGCVTHRYLRCNMTKCLRRTRFRGPPALAQTDGAGATPMLSPLL